MLYVLVMDDGDEACFPLDVVESEVGLRVTVVDNDAKTRVVSGSRASSARRGLTLRPSPEDMVAIRASLPDRAL